MTGSVSVMRSSFAQQAEDLRRLPGWLRQRQFQLGGRARAAAALVLQAERDLAHRQLARGQPAAQLFGQPAGHGQHRVGVLQVFHQLDAAGEARRRLDPALRLGRQIGGVQRRQQFGALRRCRRAAGRAGRPAWRSRCPCSQSRRGRAGAAGPAAARRACERAWAGSAPAGRRAFAALRQQPGRRLGAMPSDTRKSSARNVVDPRARGPRKKQAGAHAQQHGGLVGQRDLGRVLQQGQRGALQRRPRPADCAAAARPGARWRAPARRMSIRTPAAARGRSGRSRALLQHGVRLGVVRPVRAYGVQRQAAQAGGDPEAHGGRVLKAPGSRPVQRRIAGRPRRLRIWMDSPPGRQRQPQGAGVAWAAAADGRRATKAGRWPGPPDAAGAAIRDGPRQSRRRSCRS